MSRILVVEDEPTIAMGLEDDLRLDGHVVDLVTDGVAAEAAALQNRHDPILLDVMLPGKDGFSVCRTVRAAGVRTPILLLTAKGQEVDKVVGLELGADDYVTKPFSPRESAATDESPVWAPDGGAVVFVSNRSGTKDLWSIRVAAGRPQGPPRLLRANVGETVNVGFSRDGSYFYGLRNQQRNVYVAELDRDTLSVKAPALLTEKFVGSNAGPAWSQAGRHVAFVRGRDRRALSLVVHEVATGIERTLPTTLEDAYSAFRHGVRWMSRSSLLVSDTVDRRRLFRRVDIDTGRDRVVFDAPYETTPVVAVSSSGRELYYSIFEPVGDEGSVNALRLMRRDLETGRETELYRAESTGIGFFGLSLSPDGSTLAFSANTMVADERLLMTMPVEGGRPSILLKGTYNHPTPLPINWTADGRHLVFVAAGREPGLWAIPSAGGEPRQMLSVRPQLILATSISPDGRKIAFTGTQERGELWVIKNLLADVRRETPGAK